MNLDLSGCKKRKRGERVFRFKSFGEKGHPIEFDGTFGRNVEALVQHGSYEGNSYGGISSWSFQLETRHHPLNHVFLFVIEEQVDATLDLHCRQCRYVGWGHHMICNRKYHFVLPSKLSMPDTEAGNNSTDGADSTKGKSSLIEFQGHILHGVFHSDGFGHLLSVNGFETGSHLAGHQIMDFWDRLCTRLRAREVSLSDISQKKGMELRVLHGLAYGEHWFGRWGYRFARGTFGVSKQMYQKATEAIRTIPLCIFLHQLGTFRNEITFIVSRYQTLSECSLVTLGDLFHFMMELKSRLPKENSGDGIPVEDTCRWSSKRVELATEVIVEALRKSRFKWVSRQEVRDAARAYIGDTGLLDFVLKSLGNHIVGKYLVRRSLNPVTKVLEYCLEDISNIFPKQEVLVTNDSKKTRYQNITRIQIMKDIYYLYKHILKERKGSFPSIPLATRIILDSKYLVKDYSGDNLPLKFESGSEKNINLYCTVMLDKVKPPYELVVLKDNVTIDELKLEVEKVFRGLYWGLRDLVVKSIVNLNSKGGDLVSGVVEAGSKIVFEGSGIKNEDIYESGENNHIVDCGCGTKDDDGERMISCDICEVWQHTRCVRILNNEEIPQIFVCDRCERDILLFPSLP